MNNKVIIAIIIVLVLAGGGYYIYSQNKTKTADTDMSNMDMTGSQPANDQTASDNPPITPSGQTVSTNNTSSPDVTPGAGQFSNGQENSDAGPDIQVVEIDYDGSKFTPSTVNIKANDYVIFKNTSTVDFWPASNPHPTHTDYPGFDAKQPVAPGASYKFQFTKVGSWGFHNHLTPTVGGTVNVTQ